MQRKAFAELLASVKEAGQIKRGEIEPGRRFTVEQPAQLIESHEQPARIIDDAVEIMEQELGASTGPQPKPKPNTTGRPKHG
ncbi:MAG: hypothetical protein JRD89_17660 [Deltaproteobacteria bacterium]|nr:hypothetical protein [Deltaproteobacteria bacterium]